MHSFTRLIYARAALTIMTAFLTVFCSWTGFAQSNLHSAQRDKSTNSVAMEQRVPMPASPDYLKVQARLAQGWNTWDANSVMTHVLLPYGLAIHIGMKHNTSVSGDAFLRDALIGRLEPGAEQVIPGPHSWDGSYSELSVQWKGHSWRVHSAHAGADLVLLVEPLPSKPELALAPTVVFSVNALWNRTINFSHSEDEIDARPDAKTKIAIYCTCQDAGAKVHAGGTDFPVGAPYFAADLAGPVGVSTGKHRTVAEIRSAIDEQRRVYDGSIVAEAKNGSIVDAIETTLGWDTIYEPAGQRVISPVSRVWCVNWGGYVLFDWDTFFAATLASIGDRDLAYANAIEILRDPSHAHALTSAELRAIGSLLGLREIAVSSYETRMPLEPVLQTSFPENGALERVRKLYRIDAESGADALGFGARIENGEITVAYPMSMVVWEKVLL